MDTDLNRDAPSERSLAVRVATQMRDLLIAGDFAPGEKLSEHQIATRFDISRNTLREVFRLVTSEGLLEHVPNRGVFVVSPDEAAILDIYRVRRVIQGGAVQASAPGHPALAQMRGCVARAQAAREQGDWQLVGTENMAFHGAMVGLCDSTRLSAYFARLLAELRLVFRQMEDSAFLHEPYIRLNAELVALLEAGDIAAASTALDAYLLKSERSILGAFLRDRG